MISRLVDKLIESFDSSRVADMEDAFVCVAQSLGLSRSAAEQWIDDHKDQLSRALIQRAATNTALGRLLPFEIERDRYLRGVHSVRTAIRLLNEIDIMNALPQLQPGEFEDLGGVSFAILGIKGASTQRTRDGGIDWYGKFELPVKGVTSAELLICLDCKRRAYTQEHLRAFQTAVSSEIHKRLNNQPSKIPSCIPIRRNEPRLLAVMTSKPISDGVREEAKSSGLLIMEPAHIATLLLPQMDRRLPAIDSLRQLINRWS